MDIAQLTSLSIWVPNKRCVSSISRFGCRCVESLVGLADFSWSGRFCLTRFAGFVGLILPVLVGLADFSWSGRFGLTRFAGLADLWSCRIDSAGFSWSGRF